MDDRPAHLTAPTVLLDGTPLEVKAQPSTEKLVVQLPPALAPGEYDLLVRVGGLEVRLEPGLRVTDASSQLLDASPATDTHVDVDDSAESHSAASEATTTETAHDTSKPATTTNLSTSNGSPSLESEPPDSDATGLSTNQPDASDDAADSSSLPLTDASLSFDASPASDASSQNTGADGNAPTDASLGANDPVFRCAPGEFGGPEVVAVDGYTEGRLWSPTLSADGFTLYFTDGSHNAGKLMKATRNDRGNTFGNAVYIPTLFATGAVGTPYLTPNGLSLYFYSIQDSGLGSRDMYMATRSSITENFAAPTNLTALNSTSLEHLPWVSRDELWFVWVSQREGQNNYWTATRPTKTAAFSTPTMLTSLTLPGGDGRIFISYDGLLAYFASGDRPGGQGSEDIWFATRSSLTEDFANLGNVGIVNTAEGETDVTLTHDGEELFFVRTGDANLLYRAVATCN